MPRENLLSLFREFERYRSDIAVVQKRGYRREAWTYGRLARTAAAFARLLQERNVKTGDRVLLWAPNSAEWMAAFWGCVLRGAVAVPMDDGASADFVSRVARDAGIKLVFANRDKCAVGAGIFGDGMQFVELDGLAISSKESREHGHGADGERWEDFSDEPLTRNHIAEILFTSGTTSEPRGVVLTHGNFLANLAPIENGIASYRKYERWFHPLRFVTLVPFSHVFGQFMALLVPPLLGTTVVVEASANPVRNYAISQT